jgi:glycerophosphoryl diester phosphodiesterase
VRLCDCDEAFRSANAIHLDMKSPFRSFVVLCAAALVCVQNHSHAAAAAQAFFVDAKTPEGLRELFKPSTDPFPLLSAHRGGAGRGFPENCLATLEATVARTWAILEIDLRTTKDGAIVLMHDPTLDRTTNGKGPVKDRTLAEIRELRLKDREGNLTEHRIPTLDEAIKWARGKAILALDKKEVSVRDVVRVITEHRAESYALLMAYTAKEAAECTPRRPTSIFVAAFTKKARARWPAPHGISTASC